MFQLILVIHVLVALALIFLVLIQHGKGADMGAGFGQGSSNTVMGSQGAMPFLFKLTMGLAAIFFATSLSLGYLGSQMAKKSVVLKIPTQKTSVNVSPQSNLSGDKENKSRDM